MSVFKVKTAALALVAGVGLAGCAYGPYGGVGVGVGYGSANGYYDPYYNGGYYNGGYYGAGYGGRYGYGYGSPYGYGYGMPGYGWYDGYYYPGSGYYVYDQHRNARRWSDTQRRYWEWRQRGAPRGTRGTAGILQNWADFNNGQPTTTNNVVRQRQVTQRNVTMNNGSNHTFTEPSLRNQRGQTQQQRRTARTEVQSERRGNRGGHDRHVDSE